MPRVTRQKLRKATNRIDPAVLREMLDDGKVHVQRALVVLEGPSHFEIVEGGADVLVDVELQPSFVRCTARLGGLGGGAGRGFWAIPPVGAEVIVLVPDGDLEAGPVIVGAESSGQVPDGLGPTTFVICAPAGGQLLVHDGTAGEAVALATMDDVTSVRDSLDAAVTVFNAHVHPAPGGTTSATGTPQSGPGFPNGTSVLKAK
jgi:hypothetical protein